MELILGLFGSLKGAASICSKSEEKAQSTFRSSLFVHYFRLKINWKRGHGYCAENFKELAIKAAAKLEKRPWLFGRAALGAHLYKGNVKVM